MSTSRRQPAHHHLRGLTLLYEDRDIIVVEKPGGLLTIGTDRDKTRTAHTILNEYVRKGDPRSRHRVYIVHRLDRETSGILVFAKSETAKAFLQGHWEETDKRYLAVVHGTLAHKAGTISSYLAENSAFTVYATPDPAAGKLSHTEYRVLKEARGFSLVELHLLTGRKHQIRVHLAGEGHPIVGDKKYGRTGDGAGSLALHARSLAFTHPVSHKRLTFATGIPAVFTRLVGDVAAPAA